MEHRRTERKGSHNFLDIEHVARPGELLNHGVGRTLDVSSEGLRLETNIPLTPGEVLKIAIGLDDDVVELSGHIVHVTAVGNSTYHAGIEFINVDDDGQRILQRYLNHFHATKH